MKNRDIASNKQRLDALFDQITLLRSLNNLQIESQWATYLCIRVSGFLETSIRTIYSTYSRDKAHPNITRYVSESLERNRSLTMGPENLLKLVGAFSKEWRDELDNYLSHEGRKEAIEGVINIRHNAAHGGSTTVTYHRIEDYYKRIWQVIRFLEDQCKK